MRGRRPGGEAGQPTGITWSPSEARNKANPATYPYPMIRHRQILGIAAAASIAIVAPASAQSDRSGEVGPREAVTPLRAPQSEPIPTPVQQVYRQLAASWEEDDARAVAGLARDGRVHVVVQRRGVAARLSPGQLQYLLEELFDEAEELVFRFPAHIAYDPASDSGYAVGQRVYQEGPGPETRVDHVFVGIRNERGHWVLTELRLTTD